MLSHLSKVHEGKKPFPCSICNDVGFSTKEYIDKHIASVHEKRDRRPSECSICDKTFAKPEVLDRHIRSVHEGKKFYAKVSLTKLQMVNSDKYLINNN